MPPSHIPSEGVLVGRTPGRLRGPLFIFRKIHLYGKTKKSTHGHTNVKPFRTQILNFSQADRAGFEEQNDARLPSQGRLGRPPETVKVGLQGRSPTLYLIAGKATAPLPAAVRARGRLPSASPGSALSSNTKPVPTRCGRRPSQVSRQQYCTTSIKIPLQIS